MPVLDGWWYIAGDSNVGPLPENTLRQLIAEGEIDADTPMWRTGMPAWLPLGDIPDLVALQTEVLAELRTGVSSYRRPGVPAIPAAVPFVPVGPMTVEVLPGRVRLAGPWSRFWARMLDQLVAIGVINIVVMALVQYAPSFAIWAFPVALLLWISPLPVLLDASLMVTAGGTLGKWLLGIRVRRADGAQLGYGQAWLRALRLWLYGYGANIPIVSLVFQIMAYVALRRNKPVCWDRESSDIVIQSGSAVFRRSLLVLLVSVFICLANDAMVRRMEAPLVTWLHAVQQDLRQDLDNATN
ncbi:MAG TPA: RDD family protein [Stellaceae bacterium]|nr:RDD family protein [Stellaceae bacterium]